MHYRFLRLFLHFSIFIIFIFIGFISNTQNVSAKAIAPSGEDAPYVHISTQFTSSPNLPSPGDIITARVVIENRLSEPVTFTGQVGIDFETTTGSQAYFSDPSPRRAVTKTIPANSEGYEDFSTGITSGGCLSGSVNIGGYPYFFTNVGSLQQDSFITNGGIGATVYGNVFFSDGSLASGAIVTISGRHFDPSGGTNTGSLYRFRNVDCSQAHTITARSADGTLQKTISLSAVTSGNPTGAGTICNGESRRFDITLPAPVEPTNTPVPGVPTNTPTPVVPTATPTNAPPTPTPTPDILGNRLPPLIRTGICESTTPSSSCYNFGPTAPNPRDNIDITDKQVGSEFYVNLNFRNNTSTINTQHNGDLSDINLVLDLPPDLLLIEQSFGCSAASVPAPGTGQLHPRMSCSNLYPSGSPMDPGTTDSRWVRVRVQPNPSASIVVPRAYVHIQSSTNPQFPTENRNPTTDWGSGFQCSQCTLAPQGYEDSFYFRTNTLTFPMPVPSITVTPVPTCPAPVTGTATCTVSGNTGALRFPWTAVNGCTYDIRTNDQEDPWDPVNNTGDTATDGLTSSPFNRNGLKSHTYAWWINSINSEGVASQTVNGNTISCSTASIGVNPQTNTKSATSWQTFTLTKSTLTFPGTDIGFYNPGESTAVIGTFPSSGWTRNVGGNCAFTTDGTASCTWNPGNATITPGRHTFGLFGRGQDTDGNNIDGKLLAVTSANFVINPDEPTTPTPTSYGCTLTANPMSGEYPMTTTIAISPVHIVSNRATDQVSSLTFGDGSTGSFNVTNGQTTHTYSSARNYTVRYTTSSARDNTYFDCSTSVTVTSPPQPTQPPTAACSMQHATVRTMPWTCRGDECVSRIGRAIGKNQVMIGLDGVASGGGDGYVPSLKPKTFIANAWGKFSSIFQGTAYSTGVDGENFGDFYRNTVNGFLNTSVGKTLVGIQPQNGGTFYTQERFPNFNYFQSESFNAAGTTTGDTDGVWVHPDADRYLGCGNFAGWIPSWTLSNMQVYSTTSSSITIAWREVASFTNQHPPFYIVAKSSDQNDLNLANKTGFISSAQLTSQGTPQWGCNSYCVEFPQVTYTFTNLKPGTEYYLGLGYAYPQCHNRTIAPNQITITATTQPGIPTTTEPGSPSKPVFSGPHNGQFSTITMDTPLPMIEEGTRIWKAGGVDEAQRWPKNSNDQLNTNWRATRYAPDGTTVVNWPYYFAIENLDDLEPGDYYYGLFSYSHSVNECRSYSPQIKYSWDGNVVTGHIYIDTNKNGKKDTGEDDYRGPITVTAKKADGTTVNTFTRNDNCATDDECTYNLKRMGGTLTYSITYSGTPDGYSLLHPTTAYTVDFEQSTCDQKISPNTTPYSTPAGESLGVTCGAESIDGLNFGLITKPWIQGTSGDMRNDGQGFTSSIPSTAANPYASLLGPGGTPGIIFSGKITPRFGAGAASESPFNWVANNEVFKPALKDVIRTGYGQLATLSPENATNLSCNKNGVGVGSQTNCDIPTNLPNGLYKTSGSIALKNELYTFPAVADATAPPKNYVILVNGDLTIRNTIRVPNGTTVTFAVKGDIIIEKGVGVTDPASECTLPTSIGGTSTNCNIEGFYVANGSIVVQGERYLGAIQGGACLAGPSDKRLNIAGTMVANAGYTTLPIGTLRNERDLCDTNKEYPSLSFVERPDFIINMPLFLKHTNKRWQEVAP